MGEKPRGNLIQELSETGLYTSTGVRNVEQVRWYILNYHKVL